MSNTKADLEKALAAYLDEKSDTDYYDVVDGITKAIENYYKKNDKLTKARNKATVGIIEYAEAICGEHFEKDEYDNLYESVASYLKEIEEPLKLLAKMEAKSNDDDADKVLREYLKTC